MGSPRRHVWAAWMGATAICAAWLLVSASSTWAADPPSTTVSGLTVAAPARAAPPTQTLLHQYVRSHGFAGVRIGQLARWSDPVCPVAIGLDPAFNAFVVKRVNEIAARAGAPMPDKQPCQPNIEILFTPNPQAFLCLLYTSPSPRDS